MASNEIAERVSLIPLQKLIFLKLGLTYESGFNLFCEMTDIIEQNDFFQTD